MNTTILTSAPPSDGEEVARISGVLVDALNGETSKGAENGAVLIACALTVGAFLAESDPEGTASMVAAKIFPAMLLEARAMYLAGKRQSDETAA